MGSQRTGGGDWITSRIVHVKCPNCSQPIGSKAGTDIVFLCDACGTLHTRGADGKTATIPYVISQFDPAKQQNLTASGKPHERLYVPVWQLLVSVVIHHENVSGGIISKLAAMASGAGQGGYFGIFVPAFDTDAESFKYLATILTSNPPIFRNAQKFEPNAERLPCIVNPREAQDLADFIVLSNEAEKPGVLQTLSYTMTVHDQKLIYLAYHRVDGNLVLAV